MTVRKTAEEKIQSVLEYIKDQYDLSPKRSYSTHAGGAYSYRHPEGEIRMDTSKLMVAGGVDYYELEKILAKLQEDELIVGSKVMSEYE
jgi:hypothetical protein